MKYVLKGLMWDFDKVVFPISRRYRFALRRNVSHSSHRFVIDD